MGDEARSTASDWVRRSGEVMNDRDLFDRSWASMCTPGFVRYDHRRVTPQPSAGAEQFARNLHLFADLAGEWPTFTLLDILEERGDRLVAARWVMELGSVGELHWVTVTLLDDTASKCETLYMFEAEQLDEAIAELERQYAELSGD